MIKEINELLELVDGEISIDGKQADAYPYEDKVMVVRTFDNNETEEHSFVDNRMIVTSLSNFKETITKYKGKF